MQLNYNHLYYFHVAAIEGTVAAAAVRLGVTAATVSEQLKTLERALATDLFERTPTGLKLTDAGRLTLDHTSGMFRLGERLVRVLGHAPTHALRVLRVGMSGGIARSSTSSFLMPLFALDECMPSLRTGDAVELLRELRAGVLDLVLCESEPAETTRRGLEVVMIARTPLVAVAPADLDVAADWNNVGLLQYRATTSYRRDVEAFLEAKGLRPRIVGEADDSLMLLEIATRGRYVAVVPQSIARDALATRGMQIIASVDPSTAAIHALYQDNVAGELTRRAVSALVAQSRSEGDPG
jgi:LysR family transcriptional activator of nhaA